MLIIFKITKIKINIPKYSFILTYYGLAFNADRITNK